MSSSDSDSILWSMLFGGRLKIVGIYQALTSVRYRRRVDKLFLVWGLKVGGFYRSLLGYL